MISIAWITIIVSMVRTKNINTYQVLALFNKAVRKLCNWLTEVAVKATEEDMETAKSKQKRLDTIK